MCDGLTHQQVVEAATAYDRSRAKLRHYHSSPLAFSSHTTSSKFVSEQRRQRPWRLYRYTAILVVVVALAALCACTASVARAEDDIDDTSFVVESDDVATTTSVPSKDGRAAVKPSDREQLLWQPVLIGFRCAKTRGVTEDGVSVIEANTPVPITLYGEQFTTNTIIAFTTEFNFGNDDIDLTEEDAIEEATPLVGGNTTLGKRPPANETGQKEYINKRKFANRKPTSDVSYDCTDYDRVVSYKLTEANILSPNVAQITVNLPELDASTHGVYYYFCIKQPRIKPESTPAQDPHAHHTVNMSHLVGQEQQQMHSHHPHAHQAHNETLVWVHQGAEWWVTLRVEPPILSITNDCLLMLLLLFLSAVTSGLNLGLMSLDMNELAVIASCGDQREREYARTIAPLRKRGNYLLCSLLFGNVMVNASLTVILEQLTSGVIAVIGSTLAIVVLGEIVPQAFCARKGLAIGAKTIYLTYAFMIVTFPLSYPIACALDYCLGEEEGNVYDRERLLEFIRITGHHTKLDADEVAIISGALKIKKIKVDQIMTRIEDVFMLPMDCVLDRDTIKRIIEKGYSRIPVYEFGDRKQIVALILAKDLALLDPDDHTPLANMLMYCKHPLIFIDEDATLDVALNEFKTGKSHMAVVRQILDDGETDKYYEAIGVVTLEDVIEEVLQTEINDETDILSDNRRKRRRTEAQLANLMIDELTCTGSSACSSTTPCGQQRCGGGGVTSVRTVPALTHATMHEKPPQPLAAPPAVAYEPAQQQQHAGNSDLGSGTGTTIECQSQNDGSGNAPMSKGSMASLADRLTQPQCDAQSLTPLGKSTLLAHSLQMDQQQQQLPTVAIAPAAVQSTDAQHQHPHGGYYSSHLNLHQQQQQRAMNAALLYGNVAADAQQRHSHWQLNSNNNIGQEIRYRMHNSSSVVELAGMRACAEAAAAAAAAAAEAQQQQTQQNSTSSSAPPPPPPAAPAGQHDGQQDDESGLLSRATSFLTNIMRP